MKVKIERWGDDLVLPLPDHLIERYHLKEGDELEDEPFVAEFEKLSREPSGDVRNDT